LEECAVLHLNKTGFLENGSKVPHRWASSTHVGPMSQFFSNQSFSLILKLNPTDVLHVDKG